MLITKFTYNKQFIFLNVNIIGVIADKKRVHIYDMNSKKLFQDGGMLLKLVEKKDISTFVNFQYIHRAKGFIPFLKK